MKIPWIKSNNGWSNFCTGDLPASGTYGVYAIGRVCSDGCIRTIYVGSGDIPGRLADHRLDDGITRHGSNGTLLRMTWARVSAPQREGVEKFVADSLNPIEGKNRPSAEPITVNLPPGWV